MEVIFDKELSKTDTKKRLAIPTNCLMHLPGFKASHAVNLLVKDRNGHVSKIRCSIRKKGYPKPVFTAGWIEFVHRFKLRVGDRIIFYGDKDESYKIEVKRKITILGKHIWAAM
ncbi:B3 domain-containing protein [Cephalotus follicularis]|uniref:B3 domain-containing protein n=1 Tax=Cephalotus follicularis TaxID=3775 RepID=A0A1Q3BE98_CEPFO|nr:B3 domain-containing protein [Cephalotus follicularis]